MGKAGGLGKGGNKMLGLMGLLLIIACCAHSDSLRTLAAVIMFLLALLMIIGLGVIE